MNPAVYVDTSTPEKVVTVPRVLGDLKDLAKLFDLPTYDIVCLRAKSIF